MPRYLKKELRYLLLAGLPLSGPLYAEIAQSPLSLSTSVKPNILFIVDDSTSVAREVTRSSGAELISDYAGLDRNYITAYPNPTKQERILQSCAGYNILYYDPNVTYDPWLGVDENGNPFQDQPIDAALNDPYDSDGGTTDLTAADQNPAGYMTWNDADDDGVFDLGECPDPELDGYDYENQFVAVMSGRGTAQSMTEEQQTNFANWFTYYRKRQYVLKAALFKVLYDISGVRLGLATLNQVNDVGLPIMDIDEGDNKNTIMEQIPLIGAAGGTTLRKRLRDAGEYYIGSTSTKLFGSVQPSPILDEDSGGACQQNFAVLMSDGFWKGSDPDVGNADSGSTGDGDEYDSEFDGGVYADDASNTLADVAMHYYEGDLRSDLDDKVLTSSKDQNSKQHMVTYTVAFGMTGTLSAGPDDDDTSFDWPTPKADDPTTIDDMRHAAFNGRGEFLSVTNPEALTEAFSAAITSIGNRSTSSAAVASNSTQLNSNSHIYQARFDSGEWSGQLLAYSLDENTGNVKKLLWDAADLLPAASDRKVFSYNGDGFSFDTSSWDAGRFSSDQMAALNTSDGVTDDRGRDRVDYLRGVTTYDGNGFRDRGGILGDIINSDPIYTKDEKFDYLGIEASVEVAGVSTDSYYIYLTDESVDTNKAVREAMIYAGANDGMLHAFRGDGTVGTSIDAPCSVSTDNCEGEEVFAYVPKAVYSKLSNLTEPDYEHRYYVDGTIRVGDAFIDYKDGGVSGDERWGSVLIGMLGGGGAGVYALDVSDPLNFSATDVLWDLDNSDLSELGYTFGNSSVVKLADGTWVAMFGNGYESANYKAGLYMVNLEDPSDVIFLDTEADGTAADPNGLSSPLPVDTDGDEVVDYVYAGDLQGNMWKFDLSDKNHSKWDIAIKSGSTPKPLFRACTNDDCSNPQPITSRPEVTGASSSKPMVYFGTGSYITTSDLSSTQVQSFYGIQDEGKQVEGRSALQAQSILDEVHVDAGGTDYRITSDTEVDYSAKAGWYLDFDSDNYTGERVVSNPIVRGGKVIFLTLSPEAEPCDVGGTSWLMILNGDHGSRSDSSPLDVNNDGAINSSDSVEYTLPDETTSAGFVSGLKSKVGIVKGIAILTAEDPETEKEVVVMSGSNADIDKQNINPPGPLGRQSWIEIQ